MNIRISYMSIFLFFICSRGYSCSIFYAKNDSVILAGNNEDFTNTNTRIKINPPTDNTYGSIIFSFDNLFPQGGINDQGLFFDWAALNFLEFDPDFRAKGTRKYNGRIIQHMIESCATVEEVIQLYKTYNNPDFGHAHIIVGDKSGNCVVIERAEEDSLCFIRIQGNYQIETNFLNAYLSDPKISRWFYCERYRYIETRLKENPPLTVDLYAEILKQVGNNGKYAPTVYSYIYDFKAEKVYVYNYYNFEETLVLNLRDEMNKGSNVLVIPDLFSHLKGRCPVSDVEVDTSDLKFEFYGDANKYEIWIDENENFTDPKIISYDDLPENKARMGIIPVLVIFLFFGSLLFNKAKSGTLILFLIFFMSCAKTVELPSTSYGLLHTVKISGLEKGKEYYWKVKALNDNGYDTETKVYRFKTR